MITHHNHHNDHKQGSYMSWKSWKCPGILFGQGKILEFFKNKDLSWKSPEKIKFPSTFFILHMIGESTIPASGKLTHSAGQLVAGLRLNTGSTTHKKLLLLQKFSTFVILAIIFYLKRSKKITFPLL